MRQEIFDLLKKAVEELNEQLNEGEKLIFSPELRLIGRHAAVDSMSFVALISIIEDMIVEDFDREISLVSNRAFSQEHSPFYSIETLGEFIEKLILGEGQ